MNIIFIILSNDGGGGPQSTKDIILSIKSYNIDSSYYIFRQHQGFWGLLKDIFFLFNYLRDISKNGKNNLVFNSAGLLTGFLIAYYTIILNLFVEKIKMVQIFHNRVKRDDKGFVHNVFRQILLEIILSSSKRVISVSKGVHNEIKKQTWFGENKLIQFGTTIYNPTRKIDSVRFDQELYDFKGKVILGVGRLCKQKDFVTLIHAHSILSKKYSDYHLLIVGDGEDKEYLLKIASETNCPNNIHFWGYDADVSKHYKNADVFVLSSTNEGFGLVVVEAMNAKVPVISTNCPYGPDEILESGKYGKLVPVGDAKAMADAIESVLLCEETKKSLIVEKAYLRSLDFSSSKIGLQYKELIDNLLKRDR